MTGGLLSACATGAFAHISMGGAPCAHAPCTDVVKKTDRQIEKWYEQDGIGSLSVLVSTSHEDLSHDCRELFPHVVLALRSCFEIVHQSAARCFATIRDMFIGDTMHWHDRDSGRAVPRGLRRPGEPAEHHRAHLP